jgi:glycosyltransferase involved in cell wall biosynthesis
MPFRHARDQTARPSSPFPCHPKEPRTVHAPLHRIAFIGNYVPRRCGIATFTHDLRMAVSKANPSAECLVAAMNDRGRGYDYPDEVRFESADDRLDTFRQLADFLNVANVDVVSLQHEYGIFGGEAGGHVIELLRNLQPPVHTTLHTVLARPSPPQRRVLGEIIHLSSRVAVMTERGRSLLRELYGVADCRIDVIPHGIPDADLVDTTPHKARLGLSGSSVILTFGLLSPNKGIEHVIRAMPAIVSRHPEARYIVVGATHPHLLGVDGDPYRDGLIRLADALGVANHVVFHDRYVDLAELLEFLGAADVYVTPYLNEDQITSGTLAYAFGCGKAVVSTPFWHARELLGDGGGLLVPFRDHAAIERAILHLLNDEEARLAMQARARLLGRSMTWSRVADRYTEAFHLARSSITVAPSRPTAGTPPRLPRQPLPRIALAHLGRLTDPTGLLQHASYDIPRLSEGYCTDDNSRGLELVVRLARLGINLVEARRAAGIYAAFIEHAFDPATGRFRNFLSYDRRWLDRDGSDDCLGRTVAALGLCIGASPWQPLARWAGGLYPAVLRSIAATTSPRAWALGIVGIADAMRRFEGDRLAVTTCRDLTNRLLAVHRETATADWPWFENVVAYENARLCQALIVSGRLTGDGEPLRVGLASLEWLFRIQQSPQGRFSPVGCRGFFPRGEEMAVFDQQPIEAHAMVVACLDAFRATGDEEWRRRAWVAFEWFRGHNILGLALADPATGGCRDGLMVDRTNENQGAESTLAFLGSIAALTPFEHAGEAAGESERSRSRSREDRAPCR